jgi:WD40 repeat protein
MIWDIPKSKGGIVIRKPIHLMFCILFSISFLAACTKSTEIVTPPAPSDTRVPATKNPLKPKATQVPAIKTLHPPTNTPTLPTQTIVSSPTASSINEMPMTELVSVASDGTQGNSGSHAPAISADGRYVAFSSSASNLVEEDTNGISDIFVHDRKTGQTQLVSIASDGTQGNNDSGGASISADGRYLVFFSSANNLVEGDTNGVQDCFVHDRLTGETTRVSVASDGTQANGACAYYGWWFVYKTSISADGRYVVFHSDATNLVEGDTNGVQDCFVHDRITGETTRISVASDGTQGNGSSGFPTISADGRYVAFESDATNLVEGVTNGGVFVHDRVTGKTTFESVSSDGIQGNNGAMFPAISADGRYVAFISFSDNLVEGDTNGVWDCFVHDRITGETTRVSVGSDGTQANSDDYATPAMSADGRYVVFHSDDASNLVEGGISGEVNIFVHDRVTGKTVLASVSSDGTQGNNGSLFPDISADGRYVAFGSFSDNLVEADTNEDLDVFVHDLGMSKTEIITPENAHDLTQLVSLDNSGNSIGVELAFSPNGDVLAAAYSPGPLRFYNMATFEMLSKLETRLAFINRVAFSPDGKLFAAGGRIDPYGGGIQIWDRATQKQVLYLDSFTNIVWAIAFSPNSAILATGDSDPYGIGPGTVKMWDVATGKLLSQFTTKFVHGNPGYGTVFDVAFNPEGTLLATGNGNGLVQFWDVEKNTEYVGMTGVVGRGQGVAFSPDGKMFAASGHDSFSDANPMFDLRLWDLTTGNLVFKTESPGAGSMRVTFSPSSQILASVSYDSILLWEIETGNIMATLPGGESVAFSPDGTLIAIGYNDVRLWGIPAH